jgi:DNA-binding Lrp family transcriptional regulator
MSPLSQQDRELLNHLQSDFPLQSRPFQQVAAQLGWSEQAVLERLQELEAEGIISRFGGVFTPNKVGASTLAAIAVPEHDLEAVAAAINMIPGVNHNYQREHTYNLWFVITGPDRDALDQSLSRLEQHYGLPMLDLPMEQPYHIDLGFKL